MKNMNIFIGGYTQKNNSQGVYTADINMETGEISTPFLLKKATNPSFLALATNNKTLYFLEELGNKEGGGKIHSLCLENETTPSISTSSFGENPCYLGLSTSLLLCANYSSGSLSAHSILKDGQISSTQNGTLQLEGTGPNKKRQRSSHAHYFDFLNNSLFSIDLGSDTITEFENLNSCASDLFKICNKIEFKTPPGYGPRHLCPNPFTQNEIWVSCELISKILCFQKIEEKWILKKEIETLFQKDSELIKNNKIINFPSHLIFNPKNETLYTSNRGHDSISVFKKKSEVWTLVQNHLSKGSFPRHFSVSPCGAILLVANQLGNNITSFKLDSQGLISQAVQSIKHPNPTCILFSKKTKCVHFAQ